MIDPEDRWVVPRGDEGSLGSQHDRTGEGPKEPAREPIPEPGSGSLDLPEDVEVPALVPEGDVAPTAASGMAR